MKLTLLIYMLILLGVTPPLMARILEFDIYDREQSRQHYLENQEIAHGIKNGSYFIGEPEFEEALKTYLNYYKHRSGVPQLKHLEYVDPMGTDPDAWNLDFPSGFQPNYRPIAISFGRPTNKQDFNSLEGYGSENLGTYSGNPHTAYVSEIGVNDLFNGREQEEFRRLEIFRGPKGKRFNYYVTENHISDAGYIPYNEYRTYSETRIWNARVGYNAHTGEYYSLYTYLIKYKVIPEKYIYVPDAAEIPERNRHIWEVLDVEITLDGEPVPLDEIQFWPATYISVGFMPDSPTGKELCYRPPYDRVLRFSFKNIPMLPVPSTMDWEYYIQESNINDVELKYLAYREEGSGPYSGRPVGGWNPETSLPNQRVTRYAPDGTPAEWAILDDSGNVLEHIENKATKVVYRDVEWTSIIYDPELPYGQSWNERIGWHVVADLGLIWNQPSGDGKTNWFYLEHPSFEGWYWTSKDTWPNIYSSSHNAWLWWGLTRRYAANSGDMVVDYVDTLHYTYMYNYTSGQWLVSEGELQRGYGINESGTGLNVPGVKHPRSQWLDIVPDYHPYLYNSISDYRKTVVPLKN